MCGLCGVFTTEGLAQRPEYATAVRRMASLMARRGPDDEGYWTDPEGRLALGFRRLAVLDLTPAGRQPMVSADGGSVLAFNGEIYNHLELKDELAQRGIGFRSRSDTEVLLEALRHWGVGALGRLNGMFALAWYNLESRSLLLARDHAGIKPLHYFVPPGGRGIAFASQYDALLHTPWGRPGRLRPDVLRLFLRLHHIPPPYGLLEDTYQLEPGHYVQVGPDGTLTKRRWWALTPNSEPNLAGDAAVEALAGALDRAVQRQRAADVPVGVFLSGGVDSPLVAAVARRQAGAGLEAFTIANPGWRQDEAEAAGAYARHLDVRHHLETVTGDEALAAIPDVIAAQHEPFADYSILPTLLVSQHARSRVTVALSGDGGDELFFGYERPVSLLKNGAAFRWPYPLRLFLYAAGRSGLLRPRSGAIAHRDPGRYYLDVNSRLSDADLARLAPDLPPLPKDFDLYRFEGYRGTGDLAEFSRRAEFYGQLQRGLKKVDLASMHHSLEVRVPFLDRDVIDVALRIAPSVCLRDGQRKWVLRRALARHVPEALIPQTKLGFAVPLGEWLRGPLRERAEATLLDGAFTRSGLFRRRGLERYWREHLTGARDRKWGLWTLLAFAWWQETHPEAA